jgi:hyperosmotically inducible periplasmic protein
MNRFPFNKASLRDALLVTGLAFGLALSMPAIASATASRAPAQSTGASKAVSDSDVTVKVKQRLAETQSLRSAKIGVSTVNGVVTLSGTVSDQHVKHAAVALAVQVQGVKVVDDELKTAYEAKLAVDPKPAMTADDRPVPDSRITANVQALLDQIPSPYKVNARTDHGVVFLTGDLQYPSDIQSLRQTVKRMDGVRSVNTAGLDAAFVTVAY